MGFLSTVESRFYHRTLPTTTTNQTLGGHLRTSTTRAAIAFVTQSPRAVCGILRNLILGGQPAMPMWLFMVSTSVVSRHGHYGFLAWRPATDRLHD